MTPAQKYENDKVAKKAPIHGISIGVLEDKNTWSICFKNTVTDQQIAEANAELQNYDPLPTIIEAEAKRASDRIGMFIEEKYSLRHQMVLSNLRMEAKVKKKASAEAYLDDCWNWMAAVMQVYYVKEAEIKAIAAEASVTKTKKEVEDALVPVLV